MRTFFPFFLFLLTAAPRAQAAVTLSSDQQIYEGVELSGGSYSLSWNLPYAGGATLASNTSYYLYAQSSGGLTESPATSGPQIQWPNLSPLDPELWTPPGAPSRILKAGQVYLLPQTAPEQISYVNGKVQVDFLQSDGVTPVSSRFYSDFSLVPLSGYIESSPAELQDQVPFQSWVEASLFGSTAKWAPGAAYLKRSATRNGDVTYAEDCVTGDGTSLNSSALPIPCPQGTTLEAIFPINLSTGNGPETEFLADGTISQVDGVRMWIANAALPQQESATLSYRVFFELSGAVYRGYLEKDGTPILSVQTDGGVESYSILFNEAAVRSLQAGLITSAVTATPVAGAGAIGPTVDIFRIGGHGPNGSLSPADLKTHYDIPPNLTGAGQTIAIVDGPGSGDVEDDLNTFSQFYGLPPCSTANRCFQHIDLSAGAAITGTDWIGEVALDTQMVHAIAPGAKIILVTAATPNGADLMTAVNTAAALQGVTAISMSFGAGSADRSIEDPLLAQFQTRGLILFASSGDSGDRYATAYPAASPAVTAVGGTQINSVSWSSSTLPTSNVETAWEFSGGGEDTTYSMPSWQSAALSPSTLSLFQGYRAFPDVSSVADWRHSAVSVYYRLGWKMSGGTSAASPLWAGLSALLGQQLASEGKSLSALVSNTPGGFNGLLYQAKALQTFHDITVGSNSITSATCASCTAVPGYDAVTGIGTPDVAKLFSLF